MPKDLRGILHASRENETPLKMLEGTYDSNAEQIRSLMDRVTESSPEVVGIVGLSFKKGRQICESHRPSSCSTAWWSVA